MKNFITSVIVTIALIALVSCIDYRRAEEPQCNGYAPRYKGNSGMTLPGDGDQMAKVAYKPEQTVAYNLSPTADKTEAVTKSEELSEEPKEEHNKVDGLIIAFWHGVAAVLIGGAGALLVASAWERRKKDGKA